MPSTLYFLKRDLRSQLPDAALPELRSVEAYVAVDDKNGSDCRLYHILVVHIAEVDFRHGIRPIARIAQFKSHVFHECLDFYVRDRQAFNKGLLHNDFEVTVCRPAKSDDSEACFGKVSIV